MTLAPSTLARSAVEVKDDDGQTVATIYAQRAGLEIVLQAEYSAEFAVPTTEPRQVLQVAITRTEARRR
jgi:hypothetical protein